MTLSQLTQKIMGKNNRGRSVEYGLNWRLSRPNARPYEAQALLRLGKERSQNYRRVTHLNETGILLFENDAAAVYMGIRPLPGVQSRETGVGILSIADTFEVADEYARLICAQYDSPIYSAFARTNIVWARTSRCRLFVFRWKTQRSKICLYVLGSLKCHYFIFQL